MEFIFKHPSLQQMAELKIVSELLRNKNEIKHFNFPSLHPFYDDDKNWRTLKHELKNQMIENNVIEKVSALPIPKLLQENLVKLVIPLGLEIWKWWFYHNVANKDLILKLPNKFCWTPQGTINYKKTAELIVMNENEDIETRYKLACAYCLVNHISILWKQIPETRKEQFYYFENNSSKRRWMVRDPRNHCEDLVVFWTFIINDKRTELHKLVQTIYGLNISSYLFAFKSATFGLNPPAIEFFFEKLSHAEKNEYLVSLACLVVYPRLFHGGKMETLFFLLNQMSEEQQEKMFKSCVSDILQCMLNWPYQTFFLVTAKKWFHYLPNKGYRFSNLFNLICDKIICDEKDYDYKQLLLDFWQLASVNINNFFGKNYAFLTVLKLYEAKIEDLVKYILNRATHFEKEQLLYLKENEGDDLAILICQEKWDFLKFLIGECITSKETIIKFKKAIASQCSLQEKAELKVKLSTAFLLVDNFVLQNAHASFRSHSK